MYTSHIHLHTNITTPTTQFKDLDITRKAIDTVQNLCIMNPAGQRQFFELEGSKLMCSIITYILRQPPGSFDTFKKLVKSIMWLLVSAVHKHVVRNTLHTVYIYIRIHTHTYAYIHIRTHTYTYVHIRTHTYTYR
jgi:hypothetical protein